VCMCVQWRANFFFHVISKVCIHFVLFLVLMFGSLGRPRFFFFFSFFSKCLFSGIILSTLPTFYIYKAHQVITFVFSKPKNRPISCQQSCLRKTYLSYFLEDKMGPPLSLDVMKRNLWKVSTGQQSLLRPV